LFFSLAFAARRALSGLGLSALLPALPGHRLVSLTGLLLAALTRFCLTLAALAAATTLIGICHNGALLCFVDSLNSMWP
jgi:hypothetical protein